MFGHTGDTVGSNNFINYVGTINDLAPAVFGVPKCYSLIQGGISLGGRCYVFSTLLYGMEAWNLKKKDII